MFNAELAVELLALTHTAQFQDSATLTAGTIVTNTLLANGATSFLNGAPVQNAVAISGKTFKADTECFVARSDDGDVVVAFRGSETDLFSKVGAFKDWVLTDFRANRIPYPPAPKTWPDQRWVHAGFWQAYAVVRNVVLAEVARQAAKGSPARAIYATGFSLGGALALLAALDIADAMPGTPVILYTFAAPRAGDVSLNRLLAERVRTSFHFAFRGDPFVHLPPIGPNFPVTFKHLATIDLAGIHVGLGNPGIPSVWQQYRSAEQLIYIDRHNVVHQGFPPAKVALNLLDHDWPPYLSAIRRIRGRRREGKAERAAEPRDGRIEGVLPMMFGP
jgi:hypothetical protein